MFFQALCLLAITSASFASPILERASVPSAQLPNGVVVGTAANGIESFYGIPYAQPPIGNLRLRVPQPFTQPLGTFQATKPARGCPQMQVFPTFNTSFLPDSALGLFSKSSATQSETSNLEDCLTLDVQRPAGVTPDAMLPVVVYIFGGGFEVGSTNIQNATNFIKKSVDLNMPLLYVAMNYRLGGFGFLAGSELAAEGNTNLGLRDQRLALQWVQDNIAAFGGDPAKVTLWGLSAGSISIYDHMMINNGDHTYKGKPLFRGGIMNSGSIIPADTVSGTKAEQVYAAVVAKAGCAAASSKLACLRSKDYKTFLAATNAVPGIFTQRALDLAYLPRPHPGNAFFPVSPEVALQNNAYAKIPFILGDQEDEGTLFTLAVNGINTNAQLIDYLTSYFLPSNPDARNIITQLVAIYPNDMGISGAPYDTGLLYNLYGQQKRLASILGDITFTLARRIHLKLTASTSPSLPTWTYLSSYLKSTPFLGTFHGSDLFYTFGTAPVGPKNFPTTSLQTYFISFITNQDPNVGTGTGMLNWPKYTPDGTGNMMHFGAGKNDLITDNFRPKAEAFLTANPLRV